MTRFDGSDVGNQFEAMLGRPIEASDLWFLVKLAKFVRLRARNNAAFNNYMRRCFGHLGAGFDTVTKQHADGTSYPGLQITVAGVSNVEVDDES